MLDLLVLLCNFRVLNRDEIDYSLHELRFFRSFWLWFSTNLLDNRISNVASITIFQILSSANS